RRSTETDSVVLRQQSVTEHHKNERINSGLQKAKCSSGPTLHQRGLCGEGPHLQILMVCQHLRDSKKGTAATTLPESTHEKQTGVATDGGLLPHHYRKCTNLLHLGVVLRLHRSRQESPPKGHQHSTKKSLAAHCPPWNSLHAPATLAGPITS